MDDATQARRPVRRLTDSRPWDGTAYHQGSAVTSLCVWSALVVGPVLAVPRVVAEDWQALAILLLVGVAALAGVIGLRRHPTAVRVDGTHLRTRHRDIALDDVTDVVVRAWSAAWRPPADAGEVLDLHGRWPLRRLVEVRAAVDGRRLVVRIAAARPEALAAALRAGRRSGGAVASSSPAPRHAQPPLTARAVVGVGLVVAVALLLGVLLGFDGERGLGPAQVLTALGFAAAFVAFAALVVEAGVPTALRVDDEAIRTDRGDIPLRAITAVRPLSRGGAVRREMAHAGARATLHWSRNLHGGQATMLPAVAIDERRPDGEVVSWLLATRDPEALARAVGGRP